MKMKTSISANSIETSAASDCGSVNVLMDPDSPASVTAVEVADQGGNAAGSSSDRPNVAGDANTDPRLLHGQMVLSASFASAATALLYSKFGKAEDFSDAHLAILHKSSAVKRGDHSELEEVLVSQIEVLNSMFCRFASDAAAYMGKDSEVVETYLRIAMKAQAQTRASIETLVLMKNPTTVIARQANIASGPQQVNNTVPNRSRAKKSRKAQNELKEAGHG